MKKIDLPTVIICLFYWYSNYMSTYYITEINLSHYVRNYSKKKSKSLGNLVKNYLN